ncbi:hypothetical protein GCM10027295_25780 [Pseudaeromonas pectinilytica]
MRGVGSRMIGEPISAGSWIKRIVAMVLAVGRVMYPPASGLSRIETAEDVHWTMARLESPLPFRELTFADIR